MTAEEFVQYMQADALAETIASAWDWYPDTGDKHTEVMQVSWAQLVSLLGTDAAITRIACSLEDLAAFLEVVS